MSLILSLGADYFSEYFRQGLFVYEGRVLEVLRPSTNYVSCYDRATAEEIRVPNSFFTGFKVFEYPTLGYRRFDEHTVGYATKQQSAYRGLRTSQVDVLYSPATRAIADARGNRAGISKERMGKQLLMPTFDTAKDINRLLAGETTGLVLNESVLIEPSVTQDNAGYNVFYRQARVAKLSNEGQFEWYNDKHTRYINGLLEAA